MAPEPHDPQPHARADEGLHAARDRHRPEGLTRGAGHEAGASGLDGRRERRDVSRLQREEGLRQWRPLHLSGRRAGPLRLRARTEPLGGRPAGRARAHGGPPASRGPPHGPLGQAPRHARPARPLRAARHGGGPARLPEARARGRGRPGPHRALAGEVLRARRRGLVGRGDDLDAARLARPRAPRRRALHDRDLRHQARVVVGVDGDHGRLHGRDRARSRPVQAARQLPGTAYARPPAGERQPRRRVDGHARSAFTAGRHA